MFLCSIRFFSLTFSTYKENAYSCEIDNFWRWKFFWFTDCNLTKDELHALRRLRNDKDIVILPADKGRVTVVVDKKDPVEVMTFSGFYTQLLKLRS